MGHSRFGDRSDVNLAELSFEAIQPAIEDSGVSSKDIPYMTLGSMGVWSEEPLPAVVIAEYCGLTGAGLARCEAACASGSAATFNAYSAIRSKQIDMAIVVGSEKMKQINVSTIMEMIGRAGYYMWEFENFGMTFPAYYAIHAVQHMEKYGTTEEDMALVAVKNHKYGAMNPIAHLQFEITLEEAINSNIIAWPLKLFDCCPITDGAAALILASEKKVKELKIEDPIWIEGIGFASDTANMSKRETYVGLEASVKAARIASGERSNAGSPMTTGSVDSTLDASVHVTHSRPEFTYPMLNSSAKYRISSSASSDTTSASNGRKCRRPSGEMMSREGGCAFIAAAIGSIRAWCSARPISASSHSASWETSRRARWAATASR